MFLKVLKSCGIEVAWNQTCGKIVTWSKKLEDKTFNHKIVVVANWKGGCLY